ncbi:hypothetical protein [Hymenobacter nivis]|uniref:Uncharacterized protein n=1 Tax=Hymenobacter nivis TaxID=1850093 RepID=A0A502HEA4_9BACT|nr:hypothetical protein [Hymenobacter nivis]TPG72005.1 hypothetical protein EAH73_01805 [Hymenobacter nivis]
MKTPAKTAKTIKGMNVATVKESAVRIVNLEISRQLTEAGRRACLDIGLLLVGVLEQYQVYYREVGHMAIDLATIQKHFAPAVWEKLNNNQRLVLEAAMHNQVKVVQGQIFQHMKYLLENKAGMDRMGPGGQEAVEARLRELQGLEEEAEPAHAAAL